MKYFTIMALTLVTSVHAQNFSPAASGMTAPVGTQGAGTVLGSPSAIGADSFNNGFSNPTSMYNNPSGVGTVPGTPGLDNSNTAPTSIPSDTTLLGTPSNNPPMMQSQEAAPSGTGSGASGVSPGTGGTLNDINSGSPIMNP